MNTLVRYLTKLSLAGVAAVILTLGPAQAFHKGVVHGGVGTGEPTEIQTLDSLACGAGDIAKFDSGAWGCAIDEDTAPTTTDIEDLGFVTGGHTNAETICGTGKFLDGDGSCVDLLALIDELQAQIDYHHRNKAVFVTSDTFPGDLVSAAIGAGAPTGAEGLNGGLDSADYLCQAAADSAGAIVPPGEYKAWISSGFGSPSVRFTQSSSPYVLIGDDFGETVIANDWSALINANSVPLLHAIDVDEFGLAVAPATVWTGTNSFGMGLPPECNDWTGRDPDGEVGKTDRVNESWTRGTSQPCSSASNRLYCFAQ